MLWSSIHQRMHYMRMYVYFCMVRVSPLSKKQPRSKLCGFLRGHGGHWDDRNCSYWKHFPPWGELFLSVCCFLFFSLSFKEIFNFSLSDMERNKQEAGMTFGCSEWDRQVAKLERGPVNTNKNTTNNVQQVFLFLFNGPETKGELSANFTLCLF